MNVLNRGVPDAELGRRSRCDCASGSPPKPRAANAATKRMVRAFLDEGVRGADARVGEIVGPLFDTEDLKGGVRSFLDEGPGKARFEGR